MVAPPKVPLLRTDLQRIRDPRLLRNTWSRGTGSAVEQTGGISAAETSCQARRITTAQREEGRGGGHKEAAPWGGVIATDAQLQS